MVKTFLEYLQEKVLSIGLNPKHAEHRQKYRDQIHDVLHKSYQKIGGYSDQGSGTDAERKAIHADIDDDNNVIKATRRGDKITHATIYKKKSGRKLIATGTDGSEQGKKDFYKNAGEDHTHKRSWAEVSGGPEKAMRKIGVPEIPSGKMGKLTGKKVKEVGNNRYTREIGGKEHEKIGMGHPKED